MNTRYAFPSTIESEEALSKSDNISKSIRDGVDDLERRIQNGEGLPIIGDTFTGGNQGASIPAEYLEKIALIAKKIGCSKNRVIRIACVISA